MKKLTTMFSILALSTALGAAGCKGNKASDQAPKPTETTPTPAPTTTTPTAPTTPPPATATPTTPSTGTPPAPTTAADTGIAECDAYVAAYDKFNACDKVPAATKDASKTSIDQMKASWSSLKDPKTPEASKKAAADACKAAQDALEQSAKALGCTL